MGADEIGHVPNEEKVRLIVECYCSFVIALVHREAAGKTTEVLKKVSETQVIKSTELKKKSMGKLYALSQVGEPVKILRRIDPGCWRRGSRQCGSQRTQSRRTSTSAKQTLAQPRAPNKLSLTTKALLVSRLVKPCSVLYFSITSTCFYIFDPWIKIPVRRP